MDVLRTSPRNTILSPFSILTGLVGGQEKHPAWQSDWSFARLTVTVVADIAVILSSNKTQSVCLSRISALTREHRGLGRLKLAQVTRTPVSKSKGQRPTCCCCLKWPIYAGIGATSRINTKISSTCRGGGISWQPSAYDLLIKAVGWHTVTWPRYKTYIVLLLQRSTVMLHKLQSSIAAV